MDTPQVARKDSTGLQIHARTGDIRPNMPVTHNQLQCLRSPPAVTPYCDPQDPTDKDGLIADSAQILRIHATHWGSVFLKCVVLFFPIVMCPA
ncbi:hypothetical protein AAFF_G00157490 [Aldrovandia affinis]|uniref:Uncharacterized protein n=1 Tax=Aldrovandia affinis TaxID=143900 RepID=A0AAD7W847_9TELE|nr:hypothetical protein AAFF_G00157490 [Aldrovandia affinis]